ncbi:hypothetical protein MAMC_01814 [Methylacidimicrobium cyclopophantes]|uniref:Uncharacterized protein n=1 Tax=Methylacidimicrobium cyclopophantes TaxID=1041766 RepID=A0A5E6ME68_9BACT|nr:hypothetical protein [Methylacidimicrobium cyclopophantes]VVM07772.1 hypothetical protein MAMC_01814 [Methylacidimicrobium cyclopophantes]
MKLRCPVDPVEALRRGIDAPEAVVLDLSPAVLSPAEREWLADTLRKGESGSTEETAPLIFPYPIPTPSVEGLREVIAAHIADRPAAPEHGITTRLDAPSRQEERPAAPINPVASPSHPMGEVAKAAGWMGLGAIMGGMLDRVFGPRPQPPLEVFVEPDPPPARSLGEPHAQEAPTEEPPTCCEDPEEPGDSSASLAEDDSDDSGFSGGDYDLV